METELIQLLQRSNAMEDGKIQSIIQNIISSHNLPDILHVVDFICDEKVLLSVSKEAMKIVSAAVEQFDDPKSTSQFVDKIIQCTLPHQSAFEEVITFVRGKAAAKYESCGLKKEAAEELSRLYEYMNDMRSSQDSQMKQKSSEYLRDRVDTSIHSAKLFTEIGDLESAYRVLMRISDKISDMPSDDRSVLEFKLLSTRLFDLRHDFIRAAQRYVELFRQPALSHEERMRCLLCCAQCALLAEAGPERATVLTILIKDERTPSLACYPLLRKIYYQQILRHDDIVAIQGMLQDHQKVRLAGEKLDPLAHAVLHHNVYSAANIYSSIHLNELAQLLGTSEEEAEDIAAYMIRQKRINAKIDQVNHLLFFNNKQDPLATWDKHIDYMCNTADEAADMIKHFGDMM